MDEAGARRADCPAEQLTYIEETAPANKRTGSSSAAATAAGGAAAPALSGGGASHVPPSRGVLPQPTVTITGSFLAGPARQSSAACQSSAVVSFQIVVPRQDGRRLGAARWRWI
jgi:hypothetical protein